MGTRAFSHDSIFIPDEQAEDDQEAQASSQDCVVGKVKSLQQQLGKNIRFGQPPPINVPVKKIQDLGSSIEKMEETHLSPMEASGECDPGLITDGNRARSLSSHSPRNVPEPEHKPEEKATPVKTSRPKRPSGTIDSINLDAVPQSVARLDNSAAKHKLSVKPKNQRVSKKHRGMSQEFHTIEDNENEITLNMQRCLDKAMFHSMDIPLHDIVMSDHLERKIRETQQLSEQFRTLVPKGENKINKDQEGKQPDPSTSRQVVQETKHPDEEKKSEADKRKEEERKRQEIIKNIDLERLQQKIKEQNEKELKEQRRREEERKQRAEQILKELEEHGRQEEQKQRELEQKKTLRLAEEQKKRELEIQRALQIAEEERKQEMEKHRAIQLVEEQRKRELEQRAIQIVEKQRKYEQEKRETRQIGCDLEEWGALQKAEEQKQLDVKTALRVAQEQKKIELQQEKDLQIAEEHRKHQLELKQTLQIMEQQKTQELGLQKAEEQQKSVQIVKQKGQEVLEKKASQIAKEQQLQKPKSQSQQELEDIKVQQCIKEELRTDNLNRKKPNFQEKEFLRKKEQPISEDIKGPIPEHLSPLHTEAVSAEKDLPEEQKMEVEVKEDEEELKQIKQKELESQEQERINQLRWQELDQKQRPFTFKVTSGEKQIIFEKVNLSPVTVPKEPVIFPGTQDAKENKGTISSHSLSSAQCIPHTAILVTGAQLCGTAVNLHQIKDPACKSLLGLNEERKLDITENKMQNEKDTTKHVSGKTKYTSEALDNQSFLAEWASIRSKMLSKAENVNVDDNQSGPPASVDDRMVKGKSDSHSSLRKTMSAIPKFSITPAWQKFPETGKLTEISIEASIKPSTKENIAVLPDSTPQGKTAERTIIVQEMVTRIKKQVTIDGNAEGWIFSKDLPSFLVPNPPQSPRRGYLEGQMSVETKINNGTVKIDKFLQSTEDKISPFGIKLRRTNYSLRFHADPQNEQRRKKRYSAGDSFEGVPAPLTPTDETEIRTITKKELLGSPVKMKKDNLTKDLVDTSSSAIENVQFTAPSLVSGSSPHVSLPIKDRDRVVPTSPVIQKPSLAPKPASPTPPSSPLSHLGRTNVTDLHGQRLEKNEMDKETVGEMNFILSSPNHDVVQQDKEGLSSVSGREKTEKRAKKIGKDRPVLQSRHSLDGSRLMEKADPAQPQWITLALQKQKGFREQQASRDERRQTREAKQVDKLTKENVNKIIPPTVYTGEYRGRSGSLQKPLPQEEKKSDTVVTRLQRREQLQKSNTLPASVTVEITETVPVSLAKDLPKRFSTPDASPVSSEPTWLALAKRKSKAWSDCPQIIK
ncbi:PREDICTED: uncharacterized protein KIAA1211 homolog [Nanorana parkeri]|uniref:uncharacterized protein KIAA1211 homolog n=1 Tax=Nanorana parkeri TaxID=125878 RepID=UPI0008543B64|nr:PREDICTED: uncharacterized protein KIAA1211 homolog [Nanorana parkeri]